VLERGEVVRPNDVDGLELTAYERMFRGGGILRSQDDHIGLMAGSVLGGGTTVNWCSCPDPPAGARRNWEREHGLEGIAGLDFDRHLDAVRRGLGVNCRCSDLNGPNRRLLEGCETLGREVRRMPRNVDRSYYVPAYDGFTGFGDRSGAKNSAAVSFLAGAAERGIRIVTGCTAGILRRLAGGGWRVEADRREGTLSVQCRHVALAAGALDSPALLLRSGLGGAAVGAHLRLHPSTFVVGFFAERQDPWWGPPQSLICEAFAELEDGFGFVVEATQFRPGLLAAALPWHTGDHHARLMRRLGHAAQLIAFVRDRGAGRVTLGPRGIVRVRYPLRDALDRRNIGCATGTLARILEAAGASELITAHTNLTRWRRREAFGRFVDGLGPAVPGDRALFSLHQMGSCRLGRDPADAVADPHGEVFGAPGVWVADASGFPEALGVNPMLTTMAMARRTAEAILAAS
jgi:choline dehydrogenase-like flavoprotein